MKTHNTPEKSYDLERLIFFSDGVFAIAITLLTIELRPPAGWDGSLQGLVNGLQHKVLYYAISFVAIGAFWMAHRLVFRYVQKFSETSSWLNILFLLLIGLVPLTNAILMEAAANSLAAVEVYIGLIVLLSLVLGLQWIFVSLLANLVDPRVTAPFKWVTLLRLAIIPPVMCTVSLYAGTHYGLPPTLAFVGVMALIFRLIRSEPFGKAAPQEETPPIT